MAVGIWTIVDHAYMEQLLGTNLYMSAAYILIATGIIVILVSFFGCMGAVKEIKCMLLTVSTCPASGRFQNVNVFCFVFFCYRFPVFHRHVRYICDDARRWNPRLRVPFQRENVHAHTHVFFAKRIRHHESYHRLLGFHTIDGISIPISIHSQ